MIKRLPGFLILSSVRLILLFALVTSMAQARGQQRVNRNEWRQTNANAERSRYLPAEIAPPLRVIWRRSIPGDSVPRIAAGDTIYLAGDQWSFAVSTSNGRTRWALPGSLKVDMFDAVATENGCLAWDPKSDRVLYLRARDRKPLFTINLTAFDPTGLHASRLVFLVKNRNLIISDSEEGDADNFHLIDVSLATVHITAVRANHLFPTAGWDYGFAPTFIGDIPGQGDWLFLRGGTTILTIVGGIKGQVHGLFWAIPSTEIAAARNRIYFVDYPIVKALDRRAKLLWQTPIPHPGIGHRFLPALVLGPDSLIVSDQRYLYGLATSSGRILWKSDRRTEQGDRKGLLP